MSAPVAIAIAIALLAANGFFVAAEFALLAARRSRIEQLAAEGDRRARHALAGLRELSLMLAGAQLGITMCSLGLGIIAEPAVASLIEGFIHDLGLDLPNGASHAIAFVIAMTIVVFLHMVVGEMAPKSWAITHPEDSALLLARPFRAFAVVVRPFIWLLNRTANLLIKLVGVQPQDELALVHSPGDLILLLDEAANFGSLDVDQHGLLARSIELSGLTAAAAMTTRPSVVAVDRSATLVEVEQRAVETGRSRIVVFEGDLDHPVGVVHVRDLLTFDGDHQAAVAGDLAAPLLVAPDHLELEELFLQMRDQRRHLALVVDEHGVVIGLITMEDVIEELIGEFEDESDLASTRIDQLADGSYRFSGALRPDELADETGIMIPEGSWETVAGYLIHQLGRVPDAGDTVVWGDVVFEVLSMDGVAVDEVAAHRQPS